MPKILISKILKQQHDPLLFPWRLKNIPSCAHSSRMLYHCKKDRLTLADRNSAASAKEIWTLRFKPCKKKVLVLSHFGTEQANTFFQPGFQTPKRRKSPNWRCHQIVTIILAWPRQRIEDKLHPRNAGSRMRAGGPKFCLEGNDAATWPTLDPMEIEIETYSFICTQQLKSCNIAWSIGLSFLQKFSCIGEEDSSLKIQILHKRFESCT